MTNSLPNNGQLLTFEDSDIEIMMSGFHVGTTIPGWLARVDDELGTDLATVRDGVLDAFEALQKIDAADWARWSDESG